MSFTDKLLDEMKDDVETVETVETVTETPKAEAEPTPEPEPVKEPEPEPTPEPEQKPAEEPKQPKPDFSQLTKEEKAEHAFKRQLSKQKEKHEAEIADLKASFQRQFDEFKQSMAPKEAPKTRADFPLDKGGDDQYIRYLADQQVTSIMAERDAKAAKDAEEAEAKKKEEDELRAANEELTKTFGENSRKAFTDDVAYAEYNKKVSKAIDNGLGEILDTVPTVRDFILKNPEGPVVLNKMLSDRDSFVRVMGQTDPTMMIIAAHELAVESRNQPVQQHQEVETAPRVPHLGKPGARNSSSDAGSVFGSDKSLMAFVRGVNSRRR